MVFNPNSRDSCEYYGVNFDNKQPFSAEERERRDYEARQDSETIRKNSLIARGGRGSEDYFPQQSRDYALSHTIPCACVACPANLNSYCEVPSLIKINGQGQCLTGLSFISKAVERVEGTRVEKKDEFTPEWFFNRYEQNCPVLTREKQLDILKTPNRNRYDDDVLRVHQEKGTKVV